ncbi:MAG: hypothetical protein OEZ09_13560, partial [Betaproteobacteria bacterium]|nr:hypothetical protein [Betaproteobacteria bacterium]
PYNKYITFHNDKKVPSKEYHYFEDVINLLRPHLSKHNIKTVQVGSHGEDKIIGVDGHLPTNTFKQLFYIIKNSIGHCGIDSVPVHIASVFDKPIVSLYSHTYPQTCCPIWNVKSKVKILEADRKGLKPSFTLDENPHHLNNIYPDVVAQAVLDSLDINEKVGEKINYIGPEYGKQILDVIPAATPNQLFGNVNVRMDIAHNEQVLVQCINHCVCEITINKPFDLNILYHKNVKFINYISDEFDVEFVKHLKKSAKPFALLCSNKDKLNDQRAKLFDFKISPFIIEDIIKNRQNAISLPKDFKIRSKKTIICGDKQYASLYHFYKNNNPNDLWIDLHWMMVYNVS